MPQKQRDEVQAIQDFLNWQKSKEVVRKGYRASTPSEAVEYISSKSVRRYFEEGSHLRDVLSALFEPHEQPNANTIAENYAVVFAILLSIHQGPMIKTFLSLPDLRDSKLPYHPEKTLPSSSTVDLQGLFQNQQHKYCHDSVTQLFNWNIDGRSILPFQIGDAVGSGGSGEVRKIILDKDHDELAHSAIGDRSRPHICVLKTYRGNEAKEYHEKETRAFETLNRKGGQHKPEHLIGYHGSFVQSNAYHIILQCADGTLEDFMRLTPPPIEGEDIQTFWTALLELSNGLVELHETPGSDGSVLLGWHQDIKPTNILYLRKENSRSIYDCHFVLADLGLSHFKQRQEKVEPTKDADTHGTRAYGAPETFRYDSLQTIVLNVTPAVDIWSLGCVYSECATWAVKTHQGLCEYRRRRGLELRGSSTTHMGHLFHNGLKPLEAIQINHDSIERNIRGEDYITPRVLKNLVNHMIEETAEVRFSAKQLHHHSKRVVRESLDEMRLRTSQSPRPGSSEDHDEYLPQPHPLSTDSGPDPRAIDKNESSRPNGNGPHAILNGFLPQQKTGRAPEILAPFKMRPLGHKDRSHISNSHHQSPQPIQLTKRSSTYHATSPDDENFSSGPSKRAETSASTSSGAEEQLRPGFLPEKTSYQAQNSDHRHRRAVPSTDESTIKTGKRPVTADTLVDYDASTDTSKPVLGNPQGHMPKHKASNSTSSRDSSHQQPQPSAMGQHVASTAAPDQKPDMPLAEALEFILRYPARKLPGLTPERLELLDGRDHRFIVDNSMSMASHFMEMRGVLKAMAHATQPFDPDGLDLWWTSSDQRQKVTSHNIEDLVDRELRFKESTYMKYRVTKIFETYVKGLNNRNYVKRILHRGLPSRGRPKLNIYILTDGIWGGESYDLKPTITTFVDTLKSKGLYQHHVGIQFIRFGHDEKGINRLQELDDGLKKDLKWDIIDTTPSDGNIYKMLLGAIDEDWDEA